ncbi:peptidase C1B, bleomycin hydrolase [Chaetomium sp. MPI-SDFR-AT-0129]|nr:peptidase C1B, bleomycin hydrolase [Chaetomium sp. MPI-SDFR-AT-0129]
MSATQSRPSADSTVEREQAASEQLRPLHLEQQQDDSDEDYVYIGDLKTKPAFHDTPLRAIMGTRRPEVVPVAETAKWQDEVLRSPKNRLAISALNNANPKDVLASPATKVTEQHVFNVKIPFEGGPITNQQQSGRCWLFASTNIFRIALMQKYGLESFELSQAYLFFWDKLEKSNWFLEQIISTADMDLESRLLQTLVQEPLSDGGQWDMVYNLVTKYGLVPQSLYPDAFSARSSSTLNHIIFTKLREDALILRNLLRSPPNYNPMAARTFFDFKKTRMLQEIHTILTLALGPPPAAAAPFNWTFTDKAGRARTVRTTPLDFAADIYSPQFRITTSGTVAGMISLVHDPRHAPLTLLRVDRLGNVVGGRGVTYVNVEEMGTIKEACVKMLRRGLPVFFGCDVGQFSDRVAGVMDLELVDYQVGFNVSLRGMDKAGRLRTGESLMTHAMVLTGVHVVDGDEDDGAKGKREKTVRWRVQNSWGEGAGEKGWFVMSDAWMDEFVYQAVVDPSVVSEEIRKVLTQEPVLLPRWDPMGSLA